MSYDLKKCSFNFWFVNKKFVIQKQNNFLRSCVTSNSNAVISIYNPR